MDLLVLSCAAIVAVVVTLHYYGGYPGRPELQRLRIDEDDRSHNQRQR